jgi:hypothetical protein
MRFGGLHQAIRGYSSGGLVDDEVPGYAQGGFVSGRDYESVVDRKDSVFVGRTDRESNVSKSALERIVERVIGFGSPVRNVFGDRTTVDRQLTNDLVSERSRERFIDRHSNSDDTFASERDSNTRVISDSIASIVRDNQSATERIVDRFGVSQNSERLVQSLASSGDVSSNFYGERNVLSMFEDERLNRLVERSSSESFSESALRERALSVFVDKTFGGTDRRYFGESSITALFKETELDRFLERVRGFAVGGFTGHRPADAIAGVVHGGEYVFSAPAVRSIGVQALERAHQQAKAGHSTLDLEGFASGGFVGNSFSPNTPRGFTGTPVQQNVYVQNAPPGTTTERRRNSSGGEDVIVKIKKQIKDEMAGEISNGEGLLIPLSQRTGMAKSGGLIV